ncbi:MAG TPA: MaoC/PaaZ C-terminal domain-containing protein [Candidatus Binataceae bacterium]|nr:MaoC/PaaZ C-terminal domain-containing protein [Candidatus Binataceae bacterium]
MPNSATTFDAVQVGDTLGPQELYLSKDQVRTYARTCGMDVPRFTDDEGARKEGLPGMIAPGNLSLGLLSRLVTDWIGHSGARLARLGTTYRQPVQPDHTITLNGFVTHVEPKEKRVEIDVWIENEDADRLVIGTASVEFP